MHALSVRTEGLRAVHTRSRQSQIFRASRRERREPWIVMIDLRSTVGRSIEANLLSLQVSVALVACGVPER